MTSTLMKRGSWTLFGGSNHLLKRNNVTCHRIFQRYYSFLGRKWVIDHITIIFPMEILLNTFRELHAGICPKSKIELSNLNTLESYLDMIGSLTDDG